MGDVDEHAEPVHLADDPLAEGGEPLVARHVERGVGPVEGGVVGQGHVPGSQAVERPELRQVVLDRDAPFDADQRGDLARTDDPLDVVGGTGQLEVVGVALDHPLDQVDLLGDGPRGVGMFAGDVDRPELCLDAPLAEPGEIGLAVREPAADVEPGEADVAIGAEPPGEVVVPVEEQSAGVDAPGPFRDLGRLRAPGGGRRCQHNRSDSQQPASDRTHGGLLSRLSFGGAVATRGRRQIGEKMIDPGLVSGRRLD